MFFPNSQPKIDRRNFLFNCLQCNAEIDLDDSTDGLCAQCADSRPEKKPMERMTREEKSRRKKIKKIAAKVKHAKRCNQSTVVKRRGGSALSSLLVGFVIAALFFFFARGCIAEIGRMKQIHAEEKSALHARIDQLENEKQQLFRMHQIRYENQKAIEYADELIREADEYIESN